MKKSVFAVLTVVVVVAAMYAVMGTALLEGSGNSLPAKDSVFIKTHWQQMGGFERATPDRLPLGCWSTALAQIVYFHRLKPFGLVRYTSSKGYVIDEQLDSTKTDLSKLALQIGSSTPPSVIAALARYNYDAALAVNKDFGTGHYMHKLVPASLLEAHYHIEANRYISWHGLLPYTTGKLEVIIRQEITAKRPLFLHFANLKDFGHSVVIDGYKADGNHFMVHLNQGQAGPQDGWYDFETDLLKTADRNLRVIYTIKPLVNWELTH
jgi:hypothetical protein